MSHDLARRADNVYRMKYRKRSENDRPWHDSWTKTDPWLTDPDLETVKKDLEANVDILLKPCYDEHGRILEGMQRTWRPRLDENGNQVLDPDGHPACTFQEYVGPDYTIIQDYEVVDWFKPWVEEGYCTIETGGAIFNGARFWILAKMKQDPVEVVKDDPIEQYVLAVNGHDGKLAFRAFPTSVRVVCNNTVQIAMKSSLARQFRAKHHKLVHMKTESIRDEVGAMQGILLKNVEQFKELARVSVQSEDYLKAYFQQVLGTKVDTEKEVNKDSARPLGTLMRLFDEGTGLDLPGVKDTWWAAYNCVTEFVTHMRGRNSDNRLDNMISGMGANMTARALQLGLDAATGNLKIAA